MNIDAAAYIPGELCKLWFLDLALGMRLLCFLFPDSPNFTYYSPNKIPIILKLFLNDF